MDHPRRADPALILALVGLGLASGGWASGGALLAIMGMLIVCSAAAAWAWGHWSLSGVTCVRTLEHRRAAFGERLAVDYELLNDKLLPLAWLHVRDSVPSSLTIADAAVAGVGWRHELQLILAMLPYQRVRRRVTVECTERGLHRFGPTTLRSGSPLGTHVQTTELRNHAELLVYPKVLALSATPITSRVPIGDRRVRRSVVLDPTRVVGVRSYTTGDPVRTIDWRATARSEDLLVRVHEPAATPSAALFVDLLPPGRVPHRVGADITEMLVSVAASVASQLLADGVSTGLFTSGTARGLPVALPPSREPGLHVSMLELLARVTPAGGVPIADALVRTHVRAGVSVLVVASDFPPSTVAAMADVRRRSSVGALWVRSDTAGRPPPGALVDGCWQVAYDEAWREWSVLPVRER